MRVKGKAWTPIDGVMRKVRMREEPGPLLKAMKELQGQTILLSRAKKELEAETAALFESGKRRKLHGMRKERTN